jgi:hypothetical protein
MPEYIKFDSVKPPVREIPDAAAWVQAELQSSIDGQAWETFEGPLTLSPAITNGKNPGYFHRPDSPSHRGGCLTPHR